MEMNLSRAGTDHAAALALGVRVEGSRGRAVCTR